MDERNFLMYKSYIRNLFEYGNAVWKPYYKKDSEALEKVEKELLSWAQELKVYLVYIQTEGIYSYQHCYIDKEDLIYSKSIDY